jgi:predicted nucleic acid-binding protein
MFALDTNILVYAHNLASPFHQKAKRFVEQIISEEDEAGNPVICIPLQICAEFINVCTRQTIGKPLSIPDAVKVIQQYSTFLEISILYPKPTQLNIFLTLLQSTTTRKKTFDVYLAATLKDHNVESLYTANVDDFKKYDFLKVKKSFGIDFLYRMIILLQIFIAPKHPKPFSTVLKSFW